MFCRVCCAHRCHGCYGCCCLVGLLGLHLCAFLHDDWLPKNGSLFFWLALDAPLQAQKKCNWTSLSEVPLLVLCPSDAWRIGWHIRRQGQCKGLKEVSSGKLDVGLYIMGTCVLGVSVSAHFRVKMFIKKLGQVKLPTYIQSLSDSIFVFQYVMSPV